MTLLSSLHGVITWNGSDVVHPWNPPPNGMYDRASYPQRVVVGYNDSSDDSDNESPPAASVGVLMLAWGMGGRQSFVTAAYL